MNYEMPSPQLNEEMNSSSTVDFSTGASITKRDQLLDRLNKRNKDRQNYLDVKLEQRQKEHLQLEGADYFAQTFAERVRSIESLLQNVNETVAAKKASVAAPNTVELTRIFANITLEIQELQRYLTTSTMFLTDYKIKACQNILNELTNSCEETRQRLLPKKKFGFSGKKVTPKATVNPRVNSSDKLDLPEKTDESINKTQQSFTWTLSNRTNEHIRLQAVEVNGQDITISNLQNCLVELQGHAGSVQISNAVDCIFLCGPISRSLFAEQCHNCTLAVACQQLRLHSSTVCRLYLHVTCRAIIEDCKLIQIDAYNYDYATIEDDFRQAGLDKAQNNYTDVADFNWLSPDMPSPNWQLMKDNAGPNWNEVRDKFMHKITESQNL